MVNLKKTLLVAMLVLLAMILLALTSGCQDTPRASVSVPAATVLVPAKYELEVAADLSSSNRGFGWIPLDISGRPSDHVSGVLTALQNFESEHPDLYVTSYTVDGLNDSLGTLGHTYGIWISYSRVQK